MNDDTKSIILNCDGKLYCIPQELWGATEFPEDMRGEAYNLISSGTVLLVGAGNRPNTAFVNLDAIDYDESGDVDV
jgi:hypothetical protein